MGFTPKGLAGATAMGFDSHTLRFPYYNNTLSCSRIDFKVCLIQSDNVRPLGIESRCAALPNHGGHQRRLSDSDGRTPWVITGPLDYKSSVLSHSAKPPVLHNP